MSYDPYEEDSRFLSAPSPSPRKSPSKHNSLSRNRSNASLRGGTSSLAHELAVALLPEPTAGSKLLAEEFGIEYDEGAEGIDGLPPEDAGVPMFAVSVDLDPSMVPNGASGSDTPAITDADDDNDNDNDEVDADAVPDADPTFHSPPPDPRRRSQSEADALALLSQNLESTEKFLVHLRHLDTDAPAPLTLETLAADMISRLNETARDREEQVRELLKYEREFQRIAAEVGGSDTLAGLEALEDPRALLAADAQSPIQAQAQPVHSPVSARQLDPVAEEPPFANDWEVDPEAHLHPDGAESDVDADLDADADVDGSTTASPLKDSFIGFPPPPPVSPGNATPAGAIPHLAHLRTHTASLVSSLTSLSEHAQVNGAATTEAGRKLRALKNKLGGWRTDWDSAERSRARIERWETGGDIEGARRVDGRAVVAEHLRDFERVLFEANVKTQAIMAPA